MNPDIIFLAAFRDKDLKDRVGRVCEVYVPSPSKTSVVKWMFDVLSALVAVGRPVASSKTLVSRSAFTSSGSSPVGPTLPVSLLNRQPFSYTGKTSGKGRSSSLISTFQTVSLRGLDYATINPYGTSHIPGSVVNLGWEDRRSGVTLPKWRALVNAGTNATTPLTAQRGTIKGSPCSMSVQYMGGAGNKFLCTAAVAGYPLLYAPQAFSVAGQVDTLDARALEKLHGKLYNLQHDARIGETIGEFRQAMAMIGGPLKGLQKLLDIESRRAAEVIRNVERRVGRSLSRFDARDVKDVNAALASLYLEFTFGWKPLVMDLHAAFEAVGKVRNRCATVVNASFSGDAVYSDVTYDNQYNNYCYFKDRVVKKVRTTVRYKVGINPDKVEVKSYLERIGLEPREFIPTLYAVLPYSWLIDYFTGINALIEALCADLSFTTWTCKTVRRQCMTEVYSNPDFVKPKQVLAASFVGASGVPAATMATMVTVERSVPKTLIPLPTLRMPQTGKPWANIAALLLQRKLASGGMLVSSMASGAYPK